MLFFQVVALDAGEQLADNGGTECRGGPSLAARWAPGQMCLLYEAPRGDGDERTN